MAEHKTPQQIPGQTITDLPIVHHGEPWVLVTFFGLLLVGTDRCKLQIPLKLLALGPCQSCLDSYTCKIISVILSIHH